MTSLREPTPADGRAVHQLVVDTGVLDVNSVYAYCALFRHFPDTCVVATGASESPASTDGFVTGHRIVARPDTLFVWQVGVAEAARGQGLATRMLTHLVQSTGVDFIETTVTPDNTASRTLFRRLAESLGADCTVGPCLTPEHLGEGHAPEELFRIGPFSNRSPS